MKVILHSYLARMNFRKVKRRLKKSFLGYSSVEILTREATCNNKSDPTFEVMDEVARLTHDSVALHEIIDILHKRIFDIYRRHVQKPISLLDFLFTYGSKEVFELSNESYDKRASGAFFRI